MLVGQRLGLGDGFFQRSNLDVQNGDPLCLRLAFSWRRFSAKGFCLGYVSLKRAILGSSATLATAPSRPASLPAKKQRSLLLDFERTPSLMNGLRGRALELDIATVEARQDRDRSIVVD